MPGGDGFETLKTPRGHAVQLCLDKLAGIVVFMPTSKILILARMGINPYTMFDENEGFI
jgi:hypothetical protein